MRLFLVISHFVSFDHGVILLLGRCLLWLALQQTGCIEIDALQIIVDGIDALSTPDQGIPNIGGMVGEQFLVQLHAQLGCQKHRKCHHTAGIALMEGMGLPNRYRTSYIPGHRRSPCSFGSNRPLQITSHPLPRKMVISYCIVSSYFHFYLTHMMLVFALPLLSPIFAL